MILLTVTLIGFRALHLHLCPHGRLVSEEQLHQAVEPLAGADVATATAEGASPGTLGDLLAVRVVKVVYDAWQAYRHPELERR